MSDRWVRKSEILLKGMKALSSKKEKDRLEIINSILFTLNNLERSIHGWKRWISNLSLMSNFSIEELKEVEEALWKQAETVIRYDIEATNKWSTKFPRIKIANRKARSKPKEVTRGIYE